jgi:GAF domain-containing protein
MDQISGYLDQTKSHNPSSRPQLLRSGSGQLFSITNQLRYGLVLFVGLSLLLTGGILVYLSSVAQSEQLVAVERERSRAAAGDINAYLDDLQRKLAYLARVPGLADLSPEIQQDLLQGLVRHNNAYRIVAILDHTGQAVTAISSVGDPVSLDNQAGTPLFSRTFERNADFVGQVETDPVTRQPVVTLAVPIRNRQDEVAGVLLTQVDLSFLWFVISQVNTGNTGYAYMLDNHNVLIAKKGSNPETFNREDISDRPFIQNLLSGSTENLTTYVGLNGVEVLGAIAPIPSVSWNVVVELPTAEAYAPVRNMLMVMGVALMIAILLAIGLGILISRQVVTPLQRLTEASQRFGAGDMASRVDIASRNEMGVLATTFNEMMTRIGHLVQDLEDRTRRLEIIATLSERLTAILDLQELLVEVVNQIQDKFGYHHAHIYLLDDKRDKLVIAEGAAEIGLTAKGYNILVDDPTNLVARAARTGKVHTGQAEDRLPSSLLPGVSSEMAVPIILAGQVVGVLDVQEAKIAGLDEDDANLLRSLANQVAVAIHNARLFAEVATALAEARAAQERYQEQSWDKAKIVVRKGQYVYARPDAPAPDQAASLRSITAPVTLRNTPIGAVEIHPARAEQVWSEGDLAIVEAVTEELSLAAENLRLFEETRERATREQTIREITDKLRGAPDLNTLVNTAARELGEHLGVPHLMLELGRESESSRQLPKPSLNGN